MIKKILIKIIELYQKIPGNIHGYCKFTPSCSTYCKEAIEKYGCCKGVYLSFKRILKCNPFSNSYGYDPVPNKEIKR